MQARRISPRIPYEEAICLTRVDGKGRLYCRGLDLSATGLSVISTESCPIGTEVRCSLLLPRGPRPVTGRVVRVTSLPRGLGLAVSFEGLKPGTAAALESFVEERTKQVVPAKLRIDGVEHPLRCEARIDEQMVRLSASLPFLRLDGGVDVVLGEDGGIAAPGVISKIAVDPATSDGIPRLSVDVALDDPRARTAKYGVPAGPRPSGGYVPVEPSPPPSKLPPPLGQALPKVMISPGLQRDARAIQERPPRRRVHGTAEIARHPSFDDWGLPTPGAARVPVRLTALATERVGTLESTVPWTWGLWLLAPVVAGIVAALIHRG